MNRHFFMGNNNNETFEFHDSRIVSIGSEHGAMRVHFNGVYLFRSTGRPGVDPGPVWYQQAVLILEGGELTGPHPPLPWDIYDGSVILGPENEIIDMIPLLFRHDGPVKIALELFDGSIVVLEGSSAEVQLTGESEYVEYFDTL